MGDSTDHSWSDAGAEEPGSIISDEINGSLRVLVVDDDPSFGKIMNRIGQQSQVSMTICTGLADIAAITGQRFAAAIVDYDLGKTNGIQVAEQLSSTLGDVPVILVSQSQLVETPISLWPSNVKGFLHKALGHFAILEAALAAHDIACTTANIK